MKKLCKFNKILSVIAIATCVFGLLSISATATATAAEVKISSGTVLPQPRQIKPFELTDTQGKAFTEKSLQGHWSLLFFGFTNCQMICPAALSELAKAVKTMEQDKQPTMPQVVFITVDPDRDSQQRIAQYLASFNKSFLGARGTKEHLDKLSNDVGILYMKIDDKKGNKNYNVDHSGSILLVDPKGRLAAVFTMPHNGTQLAKDYALIVARPQS